MAVRSALAYGLDVLRTSLLIALIFSACVPADRRDGPAGAGLQTTGTADSATSSVGGMGQLDELPPTDLAQLQGWLLDGVYLDWSTQDAVHPSAGPHLGNVRTYVNDALAGSLAAGALAHPEGAAAVKELYRTGTVVQGWAVSVKTAVDSDAGATWYWYEFDGASVVAAELGAPVCTGCHLAGIDLVLTTSFSSMTP